MSDDPIKNCPECNNEIRRLVSGGTGLIFKGSGFYLTDYAKQKPASKSTEKKKIKQVQKRPQKERVNKSWIMVKKLFLKETN